MGEKAEGSDEEKMESRIKSKSWTDKEWWGKKRSREEGTRKRNCWINKQEEEMEHKKEEQEEEVEEKEEEEELELEEGNFVIVTEHFA